MLTLPPSVKIHLAVGPTDMRKYAQQQVMRSWFIDLSDCAALDTEISA